MSAFLALGRRRSVTFQERWGVVLVPLAGDGTPGSLAIGWDRPPRRLIWEQRDSAELREGEYWSERGKEGRKRREKQRSRQSLQVEQGSWTHKVLEEEQPGDTKTYLNVQVWNKKSSHTVPDVSFPTWRGWQALCSVGAPWALPCQGKCPRVHANRVVPAWTSLSPPDLVPG